MEGGWSGPFHALKQLQSSRCTGRWGICWDFPSWRIICPGTAERNRWTRPDPSRNHYREAETIWIGWKPLGSQAVWLAWWKLWDHNRWLAEVWSWWTLRQFLKISIQGDWFLCHNAYQAATSLKIIPRTISCVTGAVFASSWESWASLRASGFAGSNMWSQAPLLRPVITSRIHTMQAM